jgi:hypothetical protein
MTSQRPGDPARRDTRIAGEIRGALMFLISLSLNILVLVPVLIALGANRSAAEHAWGADTAARRILAAVYVAILLASVALLALQILGRDITAWTQALLGIQVVYKLLTVPLAGLRNPVVISNVGIALVHVITLVVTAG